MVKITDLPEEVIIMIIKKLDLSSIHNLYNACKHTRRIIQLPGVVKSFNMSLNTMATVHSLKLNFFKDLVYHLQELNMCGVPDLKKSSFQLVIKNLKCLKTLDVSYTNINIIDFVELYPLCPTIKNISVNFVFGKLGLTQISSKTIIQCQNVFENLINVHFVGSLSNLMYSALSFSLLHKAKLNALKFSVAECDYVCTTTINKNLLNSDCKPNFNYFNICLLNWKEHNVYYQNISLLPTLSKLNLDIYEFIIISMMNIDKFTVYTSPLFTDFFHSTFGINVESTSNFHKPLFGNVAVMVWNKETNKFNSVFYDKLFNEIKHYFPKYCVSGTCAPLKYDWFYIVPQNENLEVNVVQKYEPEFRKRRLGAPSLLLNYDNVFKNMQQVKLSFIFHDHIRSTITIQTDWDYLKKLTFLSLTGSVRYNLDFFNILFRCCCNLITLNVEAPSVFPCASPISRALPFSRCLKNIRLVDRRIDFKVLFLSLSRCLTLENIYVTEDSESEPCDLSDPSVVIEKCDKLYNIYIETPMSEHARTKKLQIINKTKERWKRYALNISLHAKTINNKFRYCYDPFIGIFKLNPIKPIP